MLCAGDGDIPASRRASTLGRFVLRIYTGAFARNHGCIWMLRPFGISCIF